MGIKERKEREKKERKNSILDAARKLFTKKGFAATTMDDIAAMTELSKGTLYLYFTSKEDIQFEAALKGAEILKEKMRNAIDPSKHGRENLLAVGWEFIHFSKSHSDYFDLFLLIQSVDISHLNIPGKKVRDYLREKSPFTLIIQLVDQGIHDGSLRGDLSVMNTATMLWSQMLGMLIVQRFKTELYEVFNVDREEILKTNFDILLYGITGKETG